MRATEAEIVDYNSRIRETLELRRDENRAIRNRYLDAYRKYQAAINYGEFVRAAGIDECVTALCNKDWTVIDAVPPALKYFAGECSFAESGLVRCSGCENQKRKNKKEKRHGKF